MGPAAGRVLEDVRRDVLQELGRYADQVLHLIVAARALLARHKHDPLWLHAVQHAALVNHELHVLVGTRAQQLVHVCPVVVALEAVVLGAAEARRRHEKPRSKRLHDLRHVVGRHHGLAVRKQEANELAADVPHAQQRLLVQAVAVRPLGGLSVVLPRAPHVEECYKVPCTHVYQL